MIELHIARIHRSPQRVSNFCFVVYTVQGLYWAKSDCFCPFSSCGFKKLTCTALCGITESILIPYDTFFRSIWDVSWRFKGIWTKIGHCSLWCWVTHATMFQIHVDKAYQFATAALSGANSPRFGRSHLAYAKGIETTHCRWWDLYSVTCYKSCNQTHGFQFR